MEALARGAFRRHAWPFFGTRCLRIKHGVELFNRQIALRHGARTDRFLKEALRHLLHLYSLGLSLGEESRFYFCIELDLDRHTIGLRIVGYPHSESNATSVRQTGAANQQQ
jgi:hypothetical protein